MTRHRVPLTGWVEVEAESPQAAAAVVDAWLAYGDLDWDRATSYRVAATHFEVTEPTPDRRQPEAPPVHSAASGAAGAPSDSGMTTLAHDLAAAHEALADAVCDELVERGVEVVSGDVDGVTLGWEDLARLLVEAPAPPQEQPRSWEEMTE